MIGETFGNYRVTQLIGEGGMGVVYLAEHPGIGRRAAVKVLRPGLTDNLELTKRFFNEARAANAIRHPGIVEVFDCGTTPSGTSYIVMELLEGENLSSRLRNKGRLPVAEARRIAAQTASALAAAHTAGIVHRDLKPDNLFLVPDYRDATAELVKVLDFGIAKLGLDGQQGSSGSVRTRTGSVMGTPAYMSPEQCRGTREIDHRTDIYALGAILFEMLCGRPPFLSEGFGEMVHLHISTAPPAPRSINPQIPEDVERLILWCLAKEPAERVQTMTDVHAALTGRPTPVRITAPTNPQKLQQAATATNPSTFTAAAHARELGTDGASRGLKTPLIVVGALAVAGVVIWQTRGSWMPRHADTVAVTPATTAAGSAAAPEPPSAKAATVTAALVSEPSGARVVREKDGAVIGMTPFRETWPSGDGVLKLRLELDGYRSESVAVPLDRGVDLSFTMHKAAQAEPHKDARHPPTHAPAARTPKPTPKPAAKSEPVPL